MIKISERLKSLAKYINSQDNLMDVGCDHALLDIYLVQSGVINKVVVCDVNSNALQNGINNIEKYGLTNNIIPVLGYGIEKANTYNIDTVLISGLGSKTIIDILNGPNINYMYKLILQSNNNHDELRKFLVEKGFTIFDEEIIKDGKKTYINMLAARGEYTAEYSELEYEFGPILTKDPKNLDYFKELLETQEDLLFASKSDEIRTKVKYLEQIIDSLVNIQNI